MENPRMDKALCDGLGRLIAEARKKEGLTQGKLAEKAGLSINTINRFEKGHRVPDVVQFIRLGNVIRLDPVRLLLGRASQSSDMGELQVKDDKNPGGLAEEENGGFGRLLVPDVDDGDEVFRTSSTAMAPLLTVGDYAVVKKTDCKTGDMIAFLDQWRNLNIRWLREKDHHKFLVAENPDYPAIPLSDQEEIIGRVIATVKVNIIE